MDRFGIFDPGEEDAVHDPDSVTLYRIIDSEGLATANRGKSRSNYPVVCYCRTFADAVFVQRLLEKGARKG